MEWLNLKTDQKRWWWCRGQVSLPEEGWGNLERGEAEREEKDDMV